MLRYFRVLDSYTFGNITCLQHLSWPIIKLQLLPSISGQPGSWDILQALLKVLERISFKSPHVNHWTCPMWLTSSVTASSWNTSELLTGCRVCSCCRLPVINYCISFDLKCSVHLWQTITTPPSSCISITVQPSPEGNINEVMWSPSVNEQINVGLAIYTAGEYHH